MARHPERSVSDIRLAYELSAHHTGRANALLLCGEKPVSERGDLPAVKAAMLLWERPTCRIVYMRIKELQGMEPRRPAPKPWHSTISNLIPPDFSTADYESAGASLQNALAACFGLPPPQSLDTEKRRQEQQSLDAEKRRQEHKRKVAQVTKHETKTASVEELLFSDFLQGKDQLLKAVSPTASVYDK